MFDPTKLINKFFEGSLTKEEEIQFQDLIKTDPDFKKQFEFEKDLQMAISSNQADLTKEQLKKYEDELLIRKSKPIKRRFLIATIASVAILLAIILFSFLRDAPKQENENLFVAYFEPYRNVIEPIERSESNLSETDAFVLYENGNYESAQSSYEELYQETLNPDLLFYKANSLLALKKAKEAIPIFEKLRTSESTLKNHVPWYLALAYYQTGEVAKTKELLKMIIQQDQEYYNSTKAKEFLTALESSN